MKMHPYPYIVTYYSSYRKGKTVVVVTEDFEKGTLRMCVNFLKEKELRLEESVY
jgi:hypothetical protein